MGSATVHPTSAQRKLARGVEQISALRNQTSAFIDNEGYAFRTEAERLSPTKIRYRCFAVQQLPIPSHWPLLAGEAVQNLRSSLDHTVWHAWNRVAENTGPGLHTQFPIFTDPDAFRKSARRRLAGVPERATARIEAAQPYNQLAPAPDRERLAMLGELSNIDKHRTLAAVATNIHFEYIGVGQGIVATWEKYGMETPFGEGETEVSVFLATAPSRFEEKEVDPGFTYEIRVEGLPISTLVSIAQRVFEVVTEVETGEPIPPYAEYPIYP